MYVFVHSLSIANLIIINTRNNLRDTRVLDSDAENDDN